MVKKSENIEKDSENTVTAEEAKSSFSNVKQRIEHEDGGFTIVDPNGKYKRYDSNSRLVDEGIFRNKRILSTGSKMYAKGGGVRKAQMGDYE